VRVFFDENFSPHLSRGLGVIQDGRKAEGVQVLSVKDHFGQGAKDDVWIPAIARMHGVVLTQDINIHRTKYLHELCQDFALGMFFFRPPKKTPYTYWQWVDTVMRQWASIKELSKSSSLPFAFVVTPRSSKPEPLA